MAIIIKDSAFRPTDGKPIVLQRKTEVAAVLLANGSRAGLFGAESGGKMNIVGKSALTELFPGDVLELIRDDYTFEALVT